SYPRGRSREAHVRRRHPAFAATLLLVALAGLLAIAQVAAGGPGTGGTAVPPGSTTPPPSPVIPPSPGRTGGTTTGSGAAPGPVVSPYPPGTRGWVFPLYPLARAAGVRSWTLDAGVDLGGRADDCGTRLLELATARGTLSRLRSAYSAAIAARSATRGATRAQRRRAQGSSGRVR